MWVRIILFCAIFVAGIIVYLIRKVFSYRQRSNRTSLGGESQSLLQMSQANYSNSQSCHINKAFVICFHGEYGYLVLISYKAKKGRHGQLSGGGVDSGEDPLHAVSREFMEETGLIINPSRFIFFRDIDKKRFYFLQLFNSDSELNIPGRTAAESGQQFYLKLSSEHVGFTFIKDKVKACEAIALHSGGTPSSALSSFTPPV